MKGDRIAYTKEGHVLLGVVEEIVAGGRTALVKLDIPRPRTRRERYLEKTENRVFDYTRDSLYLGAKERNWTIITYAREERPTC